MLVCPSRTIAQSAVYPTVSSLARFRSLYLIDYGTGNGSVNSVHVLSYLRFLTGFLAYQADARRSRGRL